MNSQTTQSHIPATVLASPERLPAVETKPAHGSFVRDLKLMMAALGAGGSVVPMGDNGRATRQLAQYAQCLNARP